MNQLKRFSASLLAASLIHLSAAPAFAAASRGVPTAGVPVSIGVPVVPAGLPAPALPSLPVSLSFAAPAATLSPAAPAAPIAANAALTGLSAEAAPSASLPAPEASARLERHYSGASALPAESPVQAAAAGSGAPTGLAPAAGGSSLSPKAPSAPGGRGGGPRRSSQRGAVSVKLLAIIGGAVVVVGIVVALIVNGVNKGNEKDKLWADSKARETVVLVEKARRDGDGQALTGLAAEARAREKALQESAAEARSRKADKTGDGTETGKAEALGAFEGLAGMRAEVNGDAVAKDPSKRIGGETAPAWESRLAESEKAAKAGDWRGLAVSLRSLRDEMAREKAASERFAGDLKDFDAQVPSLGGALLKEQSSKGHADLREFDGERAREADILAKADATLRAAVADQLARDDASFRSHVLHKDRLGAVSGGRLVDLLRYSDEIDSGLKHMAEHRKSEADHKAEAAKHLSDPVKDSQGNPVLDKDGNPVTVDNSGHYYDLAEKDAAAARDAAVSTAGKIEEFNRVAKELRANQDVKDEDLAASLPSRASVNNMDIYGRGGDLLDPADLRWRAGNFTADDAQNARASFGTVRGKVQGVRDTVSSRLETERKAIDAAVGEAIAKAEKGAW